MTGREEVPVGTGTSDSDDVAVTTEGIAASTPAQGQSQRNSKRRRWHRREDPWDTLPSPENLDQRASALQIGEHLRRIETEAGVTFPPDVVLAMARERGLEGEDQGIVLRHHAGPVAPPYVLPPAPFWLPGEDRTLRSLDVAECPTPRWRWGLSRSTGHDFFWKAPCDGWRCPVCGEPARWTRLAEATFRFEAVDGLWVAEAPADPSTTDRLRQRRHANRPVKDLVVRRRDDTKFVYADVALPGDEPPVSGDWFARDDALRHLAEVALSPPRAVDQVRWSRTGWPDLPPEVSSNGDTMDVGEPDDDLQEIIRAEVRERAIAERGVDPDDEDWEKQVRGPWLAIAKKEAIDRRR